MPDWPRLSWLAFCAPGSDTVKVLHGAEVETRPAWFCEAVWDGDFSAANFDRTDLVFGSGARRRAGALRFVSSGANVDRLQVLERGGDTLVSNSLACLLAVAGRAPDPRARGYVRLFASIKDGLAHCERRVPLVEGGARLVYFHNLVWDGQDLRDDPKAVPDRDFSSYRKYIAFLRRGLGAIAVNMASPDRAFPYAWQGTLSRGYDSPAAAALAMQSGLSTAISFHESRPGVPDDGALVGQALGVQVDVADRLGWQGEGLWEPAFLAADGQGKEILLAGCRDRLRRRVFVTGFGGDYVWARDPRPLNRDLVTGGYAGLSLSEFRLQVGFINLPVPFMAMAQVADIRCISQSPEMSAWDIGGGYNRPIPRRLLEELGVAREAFGRVKTGASVRYVLAQDPWSPNGHAAFLDWILTSPTLPANPWTRRFWVAVLRLIRWTLLICDRASPMPARHLRRTLRILARGLQTFGFLDLPFLWAMERACQAYPSGAARRHLKLD